MHEVLVNRLGGLGLPRKSVVRLTDRPDMTLDVYCGRKTTMQCNNFQILQKKFNDKVFQLHPCTCLWANGQGHTQMLCYKFLLKLFKSSNFKTIYCILFIFGLIYKGLRLYTEVSPTPFDLNAPA